MRGIGALVRTFTGTAASIHKAAKGTDSPATGPLTAGQSAEASIDEDAGERTYKTTLDWYAGCASPRVQLLSTHRVVGVGDEATLMVLRNWTAAGDHPGRRRGPHRRAHDHGGQHGHGDDRPGQGAGPPAERRAARHRGLRALHTAGRRQLRGGPEAQAHLAGPGRQAPLAPGRGRPAARAHHRAALGRHPADQGQGEPRRDPLRRHPVHRTGLRQVADPHVRDPGRDPAAARVRPLRDRRLAAPRSRRTPSSATSATSSRSVPTTTSAPTSRRSPWRRAAAATSTSGGSPSRCPRTAPCAS